jgi:predicted site-specific integrase-resolvase
MQLLKPAEAAGILGISVKLLLAHVHKSTIPYVNVGIGSKRPHQDIAQTAKQLFVQQRNNHV